MPSPSGDNWGQGGHGVGSARAGSCDLSPVVPHLSPVGERENLSNGAVSPLSPVSPSKRRRFRRHSVRVKGWRAIQRARVWHLRRLPVPAAARHLRRVAVRWPAGSRPRPRRRVACTRTGRSVPGFHQQDGYRRLCAGVAASAQSSGVAFVVFLGRVHLSASCPGVSVFCRWCVDVR